MSGWESVVGHDRTVAALRRAVASGRPRHAYLLLGPEGVGKTRVAETFARALLCEGDPRPCGTCASCRRVAAGTHTELWHVEPEGKSNTIKVDAIGEIQRRLSYRAAGRFRVVLVHEAGTMNPTAQNKLLKTLEEPPAGTVLVLSALHPGLLLQTVRSRCQKLHLGPVPPQELAAWLVREHSAEADRAEVAAAASGGLPGRALQLLEPDVAAERAQALDRLLGALAGDVEAFSALVAAIGWTVSDARDELTRLQELTRDALARAVGAAIPARHPDRGAGDGPLDRLSPADLTWLMEEIEQLRDRLQRNVHPSGLVEVLLRRVGARIRASGKGHAA